MKIKNYLIGTVGEFIVVFTILFIFLSINTQAQIKPSLIFSNGMVLQRDIDVPVWGTASPDNTITISLNGVQVSGTVNASGYWEVTLPQMEAGGPFEMTIEANGETTKNYTDVYVGDVWLASGQSNMEMSVSTADGGASEIATTNNQLIRQFKIPKNISKEPNTELPAGSNWRAATSTNLGNFTAAGYYFAKYLHAEINIPIGIINNSYGGARIEAYMSEEMLGFDEEVILAGGTYQERQPTLCFNRMVNPITKFPIKGYLWYQGESNADNMEDALEYGSLFKTMIKGWRELWGMGNLPFIWVQLPNQGETSETPGGWDAWPQLRQNQTNALVLPETGEAITIDIGDVDIHPMNKKTVGERLALIAQKKVYNQDIVYQGPRYKSHRLTEDGKVIIQFDHVGSGILAKNSDNNELNGFAIASSNGTFVWANATIHGDSVTVWKDDITSPEVVQYAWQYNPQDLNFYNVEDIPAAPFQINVNDQGFVIKTFNTTSTTIERGQFAVLNWETYGTSMVTLNGVEVDGISGKRVIPDSTSSYILRTINQLDATEKDSSTLTIEVVDPKPTISVRTDVGGIAEPNAEITIIADANPPKDGSITKVELFVDGVSIISFTEEPFETKWTTPSEIGEYTITGVVTDNQGYSITSSPTIVYVTKLKMVIYEAEDANYTGTGSINNSSNASGNKYLDLQSGWVLTFDKVKVPETDTYPLTIRYLLNYEGPKAQIMLVNGESLGEITFEAPDASTWMSLNMDVQLNKGTNTIAFDDSWGWMSFDYIAIAIEDTSTVSVGRIENIKSQLQCYPNPFQNTTTITYSLVEKSNVQLDIFDSTGRKVKSLVSGYKTAGLHSTEFDGSKLEVGIYLTRLIVNSAISTKKIVLTR